VHNQVTKIDYHRYSYRVAHCIAFLTPFQVFPHFCFEPITVTELFPPEENQVLPPEKVSFTQTPVVSFWDGFWDAREDVV